MSSKGPSLLATLILIHLAIVPWLRAQTLSSPPSPHPLSHTSQPLLLPAQGRTGFQALTPSSLGILFTNLLDERLSVSNRVLANGSGVALGDYDGDGRVDLYVCGLGGNNRLYRNLGGWKFQDATAQSGIVCSNAYCRGAVFADINGDEQLDLLVATTGEGVLCFLNQGRGTFRPFSSEAGTITQDGSVTLALADVDGNGTLDLYVANNRTDDIRDRGQVDLHMVRGQLVVPGPLRDRLVVRDGKLLEYGQADVLYLNDGQGHFKAVSWTSGQFRDENGQPLSSPPLDWGLTAAFHDLNGDGAPDLYVCNDYWTPDRLWLNDGHGNFKAISKLALRNTSASSMGVDFADLNHSGHVDFLVLDMLSRDLRLRKRQVLAQPVAPAPPGLEKERPQFMRNTLFQNRGDGTFAEIASFAGLDASEWSWSPHFVDVDLDGFQDVLISAGHIHDVQDMDAMAAIAARTPRSTSVNDPAARLQAFLDLKLENSRSYPPLDMPVIAFRNRGGYRFEEVTHLWGTDVPAVHHAMAMADLDGDGDLDLVVNNLGGELGVYRNESTAPRVAVRLKGLSPNTQGIGARVTAKGGAVPSQSQQVVSGGRYMAGSDPLLVFAAGHATNTLSLEVQWRTGRKSFIPQVTPNTLVEIQEPDTPIPNNPPPPGPSPKTLWFEDDTAQLAHIHTQEDFNDFEHQPLLHQRQSRSGPGIAWGDLDGDGWDDLVIGSGQGGKTAFFQFDPAHGFRRWTHEILDRIAPHDQNSTLIFKSHPGTNVAILAFSPSVASASPIFREVAFGTEVLESLTSSPPTHPGPLAMADLDGNQTWTLFVGGGPAPGRYPEATPSRIFRRAGLQWELDAERSKVVQNSGLVRGAVWSDLNGDGLPELILACEWGPIRVFDNHQGQLRESTAERGFTRYLGWWTGVTTGDLDGDGRMDIVAANAGLNCGYRASEKQPLQLYYGDLSGRGVINLIETVYDPVRNVPTPRRGRNALALDFPELPGRFPSHRTYSEASLAEILGSAMDSALKVEANCLESMVFLNRTNGFVAIPMPDEAQWAPAWCPQVADLDGDGHEDVLLSQNLFGTSPESTRLDAGRGLILQGNGTGNLRPVPGQESGIAVYGEQRGAALADFNQDGRTDLALTQNGGPTRLFRNVGATPGLRIKLVGPGGDVSPWGAQVRWIGAGSAGPIREIHGGSGYASQNSDCPVLAIPHHAQQLWVRWPGGRVTYHALPTDRRENKISLRFMR